MRQLEVSVTSRSTASSLFVAFVGSLVAQGQKKPVTVPWQPGTIITLDQRVIAASAPTYTCTQEPATVCRAKNAQQTWWDVTLDTATIRYVIRPFLSGQEKYGGGGKPGAV